MATVGDIVVVISTASMFTIFKGRYGVVTEEFGDGQKVMVKFVEGRDGIGSLSHTAFPSELEVIGRVTPEDEKPKEKLRVYFNSEGTVRFFPVSSLMEAAYLYNQLATADLKAHPEVDFNVLDLEVYDPADGWLTYYNEEGEDFGEIYDRDYNGEMLSINVRFLVKP